MHVIYKNQRGIGELGTTGVWEILLGDGTVVLANLSEVEIVSESVLDQVHIKYSKDLEDSYEITNVISLEV